MGSSHCLEPDIARLEWRRRGFRLNNHCIQSLGGARPSAHGRRSQGGARPSGHGSQSQGGAQPNAHGSQSQGGDLLSTLEFLLLPHRRFSVRHPGQSCADDGSSLRP